MNKIKTGDTVKVIAGKDKGKDGKVLSQLSYTPIEINTRI